MSKMKNSFKNIFRPGNIGTLSLKNRLLMAPMGTRLASEVGGVTQKQIDYYAERAKGGIGAIITEVTCVDYPTGVTGPTNLCLHDNGYIAGHNELVEMIHTYGSKVFSQLVHAGRQTRSASIKGLQPVAPSAIPCKFINELPRELTTNEIEEIIEKFIQAALRAKMAEYDGIELHGAHGYLIAQFMSASSNRRDDRFGGNFEKRMSFPLEIIRGIRKEVGADFPIMFRFSAEEFVEDGRELEESIEVARLLEAEGVDALHVSAGTYDSMATMIESMDYEEGWKIYMAERIKDAVQIPVVGVGVIRSPETADKILEDGKADFLALGRAMLADPYWPMKAQEGREAEINRCISCNSGCIGGRIFRNLHIRCALNPLTARERLKESLSQVKERKRVFVIGGGPAGLTAAIFSAMKGHGVTLFDKEKALGGQLLMASTPPGKEKISWFRDFLLGQINQNNVDIQNGNEVTADEILSEKPDVVIVATGASPLIPDISGENNQAVCTAWDVLKGNIQLDGKTIIVAGGGTVGCETALYLSQKNRKIIIVEMLNDLAMDMEPINRAELISRIQKLGIEVMLGNKIDTIEPDGVIIVDESGKKEKVVADKIVLALGSVPENELTKKLEGRINEVYSIGDCLKPRIIREAVYEGFQVAIRI